MRSAPWLAAVSAAIAFGLGGCSSAPGTDAGRATVPPAPQGAPTGHQHGGHHHGEGPGDPGQPGGRLVVYADEQLRETFTVLAEKFEAAYPGTDVLFEFGASDNHARRVVAGAEVDVFASGGTAGMASVVDRGAARGAPTVIARNPLVIVTAATAEGVDDLTDLRRPGARVVLCARHTRCGDTARKIADVRPTMVRPDGTAAVAAVRAGTADAALVFRTDIAGAGTELRTIDFPQGVEHADLYAIVPVGAGRNPVAADAFVAFTSSALAKRVLSDSGFTPA
ncbi:molybdate ABC transporter substrate-binding protein [Micromonospora sp. C28SCA-DRY-2]|uniref:molybdate ABC transporter substrate-binding protein n=1 Tax=Micromonospora sp. C28SCA-DRY-2 TaxID=3059522 RepID=UPI00267716EE|nr:molybdate ABC transporter substrate-binding protein [Micromonospora sp. C28SCA-DRY-2]MDO3703248.1 molybdate ABC transporter substrate-binding protein [Micromonospora sp. C28SCA-DRY-2]